MAVPRRILWLVVPGAALAATAAAYVARRGNAEVVDRADRGDDAKPPASASSSPAPTGQPDTIAADVEPEPVTPLVRYYGSAPPAEVDPAEVALELERLEAVELTLPSERRLSGATLAALAALAGVLAIGLGAWAFVSSVRESDEPSVAAVAVPSAADRLAPLLARPETVRIPLRGSVGRIVLAVGETGESALVIDGLAPAPVGRMFQAWLIRPNGRTRTVARFDGRSPVVPLRARVPVGATVAVTLERAAGTTTPSRSPKLRAERAA